MELLLFMYCHRTPVSTASGRENAEVSSIDDSGNNEFFVESVRSFTPSAFLLYSVLGFKLFSLSVLFPSKSTTPSPLLHVPSLLVCRKAQSADLSSS
uniref:Uncharacterized protein n=1 Tax=Caenorhabditis japonica TaxID=281687 RepID=A0A8R1IKY9_CAEJA